MPTTAATIVVSPLAVAWIAANFGVSAVSPFWTASVASLAVTASVVAASVSWTVAPTLTSRRPPTSAAGSRSVTALRIELSQPSPLEPPASSD